MNYDTSKISIQKFLLKNEKWRRSASYVCTDT